MSGACRRAPVNPLLLEQNSKKQGERSSGTEPSWRPFLSTDKTRYLAMGIERMAIAGVTLDMHLAPSVI